MEELAAEFTSVCAWGDYPTTALFLQALVPVSANGLKKFSLRSKFLQRPVRSRQILELPCDLLNLGHINPSYQGPAITILSEDQDFLALEKPTLIHGHPLYYHDQYNCLSFLRQQQKWAPLQIAPHCPERGMLYRLDQGTSGVLVFAQKTEVFAEIRAQFAQRVLAKEYVAVASGQVPPEGTWVHYLGQQGPRQHKRRVWSQLPAHHCNVQRAELSFQRVAYQENLDLSVVRIYLTTGLRHQIRAQFAHLGHPLLGDDLYGGRASGRLFLHAHRYRINFNCQQRDFVSKVPQDFFLGLDSGME